MCDLDGFALITDLVSKEIVEKWIKYLRNEFPTVAFKASTQQQTKNLVYSQIIIIILNKSIKTKIHIQKNES